MIAAVLFVVVFMMIVEMSRSKKMLAILFAVEVLLFGAWIWWRFIY